MANTEIKVTDPNGMIEQTSRIVDDLEIALNAKLDLPKIDFNRILICGMGGSAIGGDIVADCMYSVSKDQIAVCRFPELPKWANEKTLVIASSYSGNTSETLSSYDQAIKRGCKVISLTSGGKLQEKSIADNVPVVLVKEGIQPRNAVGYTVGYTLNIIRAVGGPDIIEDVKKTVSSLKKYIATLKPLNSEARKLAARIYGTLPVIYSTSNLWAIAGRWRAQFNENSKIIAFDGHIPDTNHSDIVGIMENSEVEIKPILLIDESQSKLMKSLIDATTSSLKSKGYRPIVVRISGKSVFERTFKTMILGDFISLHLAFFKEIDPSDVSSIKNLKEILLQKLAPKKKKSSSSKKSTKSKKTK